MYIVQFLFVFYWYIGFYREYNLYGVMNDDTRVYVNYRIHIRHAVTFKSFDPLIS